MKLPIKTTNKLASILRHLTCFLITGININELDVNISPPIKIIIVIATKNTKPKITLYIACPCIFLVAQIEAI